MHGTDDDGPRGGGGREGARGGPLVPLTPVTAHRAPGSDAVRPLPASTDRVAGPGSARHTGGIPVSELVRRNTDPFPAVTPGPGASAPGRAARRRRHPLGRVRTSAFGATTAVILLAGTTAGVVSMTSDGPAGPGGAVDAAGPVEQTLRVAPDRTPLDGGETTPGVPPARDLLTPTAVAPVSSTVPAPASGRERVPDPTGAPGGAVGATGDVRPVGEPSLSPRGAATAAAAAGERGPTDSRGTAERTVADRPTTGAAGTPAPRPTGPDPTRPDTTEPTSEPTTEPTTEPTAEPTAARPSTTTTEPTTRPTTTTEPTETTPAEPTTSPSGTTRPTTSNPPPSSTSDSPSESPSGTATTTTSAPDATPEPDSD